MRRFAALCMLSLTALVATGCGSNQPASPKTPEVDNREAEVKEADDGMLKRAKEINSRRR
jgi:hypothetical protein